MISINDEVALTQFKINKSGLIFHGIIAQAEIHDIAYGIMFGHKSIPDGSFSSTSMIIDAKENKNIGKYIETKSGSRYAIVNFKSNNPDEWASKINHIEINKKYFSKFPQKCIEIEKNKAVIR